MRLEKKKKQKLDKIVTEQSFLFESESKHEPIYKVDLKTFLDPDVTSKIFADTQRYQKTPSLQPSGATKRKAKRTLQTKKKKEAMARRKAAEEMKIQTLDSPFNDPEMCLVERPEKRQKKVCTFLDSIIVAP